MVQPPYHHPPQLSFDPVARESLLAQGAHAARVLSHLNLAPKNHHRDPRSATLAPLEIKTARTMVDAIHASVHRLRARGDFVNARVQLERAIALGSIRARVELADMLYDGRIGAISRVGQDGPRAHALLDDPVVRTNSDCMGLRAFFELEDGGHDRERLCRDANKSAEAHSKYGMFAFARCCLAERQLGHATWYYERSANEGNYDRAQDALGSMWLNASGHRDDPDQAQDERDAASWFFTSAADQGLPIAMFHLGDLHRTEAARLHTMVEAGLHTMVEAAELQKMISDARHWYQRSNYPCDVQLQELEELEVAVLELQMRRLYH